MPLTSHYENIVERRYENHALITDERLAPNFKHVATPEPPKAELRLAFINEIIFKKAVSDPEHLGPAALRWMKRRWTAAHYKAVGERSLEALSRLAATLARGDGMPAQY